MTPLNPVQIEQAIRTCADRIHRGVVIVSNAEAAARKARRDYDLAYALAYKHSDGPAHERRYAAEIDTAGERAAADDAELAFRHAERTAKAVEAELRAWQSVGASVRMMYGVETGGTR
ncbi:hypothetical protein [Kutzneria chonburiensis]|uniref:Uncharacterized protein n=1 Tax=Kutzneria chonburiensis TaxID=1483604 RepID=A0ABV6N2T4_9PSEU|nr:hypothetical protein [Kutzneria chonburiensis]